MCDNEICPEENCDAASFWLKVHTLKYPVESLKYANVSTLALHLLTIPTSNADSEIIFRLVRRIKTDFRSSLSPETVSCRFTSLVHLLSVLMTAKLKLLSIKRRLINLFF